YVAWGGTGAATAVMVVLTALALRTGSGVAFSHPDTPVEPMIYTQTSPDVPRLARQIRAAAAREGDQPRPVVIDTTGSLSWPWAWYLRGHPVIYTPADFIRRGEVAEDSILVAARGTVAADHELRERYATPILYRHRWWFPED